MAVIHKEIKTRISQSIIMMDKASDEHFRGPPGVNISDDLGGFMLKGSKALVSVDNNSSSHGGS